MQSTIASPIDENEVDNMKCVLQETSGISDLTMISSQTYNDSNSVSKFNYDYGTYDIIQISNW